MADGEPAVRRTLSEAAARQLANATKTRAQWSGITPRWLVTFLPWTPVEAGIYRLNRVKEAVALTDTDVECSPRRDTDGDLPETFVDYEEVPREYSLNAVSTVLDVQTRVSNRYRHPYDQIQEQLRLLIEKARRGRKASSSTTGNTACWRMRPLR
jgi:Phage capsid-like protein